MIRGQKKRQTRIPTPRRPSVESLEQRLMMDGDISVSLRGGFLVVSGDDLDNQVEISQPTPGTIRVQGLEETTVNGGEFAEVTAPVRHLMIHMRQGGEDQLAIQGPLEIAGDLRVTLGDGELAIEGSAGPVEIGHDLNVRAGEEGEVMILNEVSVEGRANIRTGGDVAIAAGLATVPDFDAATFSDSLTIDNPYLPFVPGTTWTYEAEGIDDETDEPFTETIVVEVLPDTRTILGVEVRIVRDRVFVEGLLVEDTFDWYAQDDNGNVWYMGEDVTNFEYDDDGNVIATDNDGAWEAGVDGAVAGTVMQAVPTIGDRYHQEFQPGGVLDQGEVLSKDETQTVPVGTFSDVLRTKDGSVREPFGLEHKIFAPGLGLIGEFQFDIEDDELIETVRLVSVELNGVPVTELVPPDGFTGMNASGEALGGVEIDGHASIRTASALIVNGTEIEGIAAIHAGEEAFVVDSLLHDTAWISAGEAVTFRNVMAEERVWIRGDIDVYLFDSILDEVRILLGESDNVLFVEGSEIDSLFANGGRGLNTLEDAGDNTFGRLVLRRFE